MKHQGEILEKAVRESGVKISVIAKKTGYSRSHLYNLFSLTKIPIDVFLQIGKIIHHDFSSSIKEVNKLTSIKTPDTIAEEQTWKEKYFQLLEEHNLLLKKEFKKLLK